MAWEIEYRDGVYLPQLDWWLDARQPVERSFVSHAHFDHIAAHREILCSPGTARLMQARLPGERREHVLPFGHAEQLTADCAVTLYPAGHIFGSALILLEHALHGSLLYTGDFKLRRGLSAEPCATPHADVVIMETTYGKPQYTLPLTDEVLADIVRFCREGIEDGETPFLFGYSLGKSQEVLASLASAGVPIMLHPQTARLTRVYEDLGVKLPPYSEFSAETATGHVVICPPQSTASAFLKKVPRRRTAMITGWALDPGARYRYQCDAAFPLSDHADYPDLLRFVELVRPKRVLTLHGFAVEFAATLRDRGFEAWAIGQDNQLDLGLAAPVPKIVEPTPEKISALTPTPAAPAEPAASFAAFARTGTAIQAANGKLEKIRLLADYLAALSPEDSALAAVFMTARPFPQSDERTLTLGWALVKRAVIEVAGLSEAEFRAAYQRFPDAGDATGAALVNRPSTGATLADITRFFARVAATRAPTDKLNLLREQLQALSGAEARFLIKIITSDLRIGLKEGLVEEAIAAAAAQPLEAVRDAAMLSGDLAAVTVAARAGALGAIQLRVFHPMQFMLASPEPTAASILARLAPPVWLEEKYDGIRCQLHKQGTRVELYSRDLHRITGQFPDLARAAQAIPGDVVLDGELLAWREGRALPFAELQKRLGRTGGDDFFLGAEIPVSISCYDLLWLNGEALLKAPLAERRGKLEALFASASGGVPQFTVAPVQSASTAIEIEAAFLAARQRGNEGLMAKDPQSIYTPGRRGLAWLKLKKAYATLDVVVVGVEYGHGKRRDVLSDYTFAIRDTEHDRLLTVGKAYSGLTDVEIAQLTEHFLAHTLEVDGRYRRVMPDTVLEIAFDSIQPSKRHESGYALRFPRIARIRTDKTPAQIDTLDTCRRLAGGSFAPPPGEGAAVTAA